MRKISLEQLLLQSKEQEYAQQYQYIRDLLNSGRIREVKASPKNGKKPALHLEYWLVEEKEDYSELIEELQYQIVPVIRTDYYLRHPEHYQKDRQWVLRLNHFLKNQDSRLQERISLNERSFQIWSREKFLKEENGKKILKRCGIALEQLNFYETAEPLSYYVHTREIPQNLLIIENKDTFYSMRRFLLHGGNEILGTCFGTLIYGGGKRVHKTFSDLEISLEPYMKANGNIFFYFGDLDYEGIGIYENLAAIAGDKIEIRPFCRAYQAMLEKAETAKMPKTKEKQNRSIAGAFFQHFDKETVGKMRQLLEDERYIPQEILNLYDFG